MYFMSSLRWTITRIIVWYDRRERAKRLALQSKGIFRNNPRFKI